MFFLLSKPKLTKLRLLISIFFILLLAIGLKADTPTKDQKSHILIILDCSQSMSQRTHIGGFRMNIAKNIIKNYLASYPNHNYALMLYGAGRKRGCQDVDLAVGFGNKGGIPRILKELEKVKPHGATPLGVALQQACQILSEYSYPREILLISDGSDNCHNTLTDVIPLINSEQIHLNMALIFFHKRYLHLISPLENVKKLKKVQLAHIRPYQEISTSLQPFKQKSIKTNQLKSEVNTKKRRIKKSGNIIK